MAISRPNFSTGHLDDLIKNLATRSKDLSKESDQKKSPRVALPNSFIQDLETFISRIAFNNRPDLLIQLFELDIMQKNMPLFVEMVMHAIGEFTEKYDERALSVLSNEEEKPIEENRETIRNNADYIFNLIRACEIMNSIERANQKQLSTEFKDVGFTAMLDTFTHRLNKISKNGLSRLEDFERRINTIEQLNITRTDKKSTPKDKRIKAGNQLYYIYNEKLEQYKADLIQIRNKAKSGQAQFFAIPNKRQHNAEMLYKQSVRQIKKIEQLQQKIKPFIKLKKTNRLKIEIQTLNRNLRTSEQRLRVLKNQYDKKKTRENLSALNEEIKKFKNSSTEYLRELNRIKREAKPLKSSIPFSIPSKSELVAERIYKSAQKQLKILKITVDQYQGLERDMKSRPDEDILRKIRPLATMGILKREVTQMPVFKDLKKDTPEHVTKQVKEDVRKAIAYYAGMIMDSKSRNREGFNHLISGLKRLQSHVQSYAKEPQYKAEMEKNEKNIDVLLSTAQELMIRRVGEQNQTLSSTTVSTASIHKRD